MSLHFEKLIIKEIKNEMADCVSIAFNIPTQLKEKFNYTQGQNIAVRIFINNEEVRRSYSLCSSPLENDFRIAVKKVDGGLFSTYANTQLKAGDTLEVMPAVGKFFTPLQSNNKKNYVAFAAGSGITPILSIIKTTLQTEPESNFTLVYGNKNVASIIFKEAIEALKNKYINRFNVVYILSKERTESELNFGRINTQKCKILFKKLIAINAHEFFICGPEAMIFSVKEFLEKKGVKKNKIHFELFNTSTTTTPVKHIPINSNTAASNITIKVDGRSFDFKMPFNTTTILDAALQQGADLPYACKGGMCCTCKAKLLEGNVSMNVCYGLEEDEIKQGFILTCQSHPLTNTIVVDYDIK
ncbi:MAG: phenylacetate-CoA oxygenase/reductase subunit PaaK [Bacteroidetes bacterium]|nr:phenylacetate-CoA oxygenase/reductase subunit PaaK [Bacteroidota bacterium]MBS1648502.1 phenylacetate-CoA oxygenase/reductase subunit PaaK [Bacteroidota bacterium]